VREKDNRRIKSNQLVKGPRRDSQGVHGISRRSTPSPIGWTTELSYLLIRAQPSPKRTKQQLSDRMQRCQEEDCSIERPMYQLKKLPRSTRALSPRPCKTNHPRPLLITQPPLPPSPPQITPTRSCSPLPCHIPHRPNAPTHPLTPSSHW
jgi:hypothetical protein